MYWNSFILKQKLVFMNGFNINLKLDLKFMPFNENKIFQKVVVPCVRTSYS
jgi:hypothetical protein